MKHLTRDEVEKVWSNSEEYADRMLEENSEVYQQMLQQCKDVEKAKSVIQGVAQSIRKSRENKLEDILDKEKHKLGIRTKNPYWLLNLKPVMPLIYSIYLEKGIGGSEVRENDWDIGIMRRAIQNQGGEAYSDWENSFEKHRDMYIASLPNKTRDKLGMRCRDTEYEMRKGVIVDVLRKMQNQAAKQDIGGIPKPKR